MKSVAYSAPAKVIISGEHAVVYGKPALVSAIDFRLACRISEAGKQTGDRHMEYIDQQVRNFLREKKYVIPKKSFTSSIESRIPIGRGLGSSAALSVTASAALLEFYTGRSFDKEIINNVAYGAEKQFHEKPSGIDNTAATFGGLIYYRKEFEFLKTISSLNFKLPSAIADRLYLIESGKPAETTGTMVQRVGKLYNAWPAETERILNAIEKITKRIAISIIKEDAAFFAENIAENQKLLEQLHVVSEKTKSLLISLQKFGIGKITGAGGQAQGSGFILFYTKNREKFEEYMQKNIIPYVKFQQSAEGVKRLHTTHT